MFSTQYFASYIVGIQSMYIELNYSLLIYS